MGSEEYLISKALSNINTGSTHGIEAILGHLEAGGPGEGGGGSGIGEGFGGGSGSATDSGCDGTGFGGGDGGQSVAVGRPHRPRVRTRVHRTRIQTARAHE